MIKIYSANGPIISKFITENNVVNIIGQLDEIEIHKQTGLAGPNDNLQIILDVSELLEKFGIGILGAVTTELMKLTIKDFYESKKKEFGSIKNYIGKLVDTILWATGIAPKDAVIMLGMELRAQNSTLKQRNIGFDLQGLAKEEIEERMFILALYGKDINDFISKLLTKKADSNEQVHIIENPDCSVKISLENFVPYIEYISMESIKETHINITQTTKVVFRKSTFLKG